MIIKTYPEMNTGIVEILRTANKSPLLLYAAQRIEELEAEVERLQARLRIFGANAQSMEPMEQINDTDER